VLVVQDDRALLFLDGQPVLVQRNTPVPGGVGIAALNYDGVYLNCQFDDTWLWTWD